MSVSIKKTLGEIAKDLPGMKFNLRRFLYNYFFKASFRVLLNFRIGKYLSNKKGRFAKHASLRFRYNLISKRNCDISYKATIGLGLKLPHPIGIVIGEGVVIKDNVTIFQHVTLGSHGKNGLPLNYPVIEEGVKIYAGAKIIGGISIGQNSIVGANTLVNIDIPANSVAYGIPCKIKEI